MGDPLKPVSQIPPSESPEVESPKVAVAVPILEPQVPVPTPEQSIPVAEPNNLPVKPVVTTPTPEVIKVVPVIEPVNPPIKPITMASEPPSVISNSNTSINNDLIPKPNLSKGWRKIAILIGALLVLIIVIAVSVFLIKSRSTPTDNIVSAPVETVVSLPNGFVLRDYVGKLYNLNFKYTSELGIASGTTSKVTYPTDPGVNGDCNLEDVSFSNDRSLTMGIATGHCEGGSAPTADFSKVSSADGKSFFIVVKKLDETLFPGMYTISASGGIDNSDNFVASLTGVHIDAIRVKDPDKYKKYIEDIIKTMTVELSPLKSESFDTQSNI